MSSDIRAFFGGKGQQDAPAKVKSGVLVVEEETKVVADSDDDEITDKSKAREAAPAARAASRRAKQTYESIQSEAPGEEVSASQYFSSRKAPTKQSTRAATTTSPTRSQARKQRTTRSKAGEARLASLSDDGDDGAEDGDAQSDRDDDYVAASSSDSDLEMTTEAPTRRTPTGRRSDRRNAGSRSAGDDSKAAASDEAAARSLVTSRSKRAQVTKESDDMADVLDSDNEAFDTLPATAARRAASRSKSAPDVRIPTRPATPPPATPSKRKSDNVSAGPAAKKTARGASTPVKSQRAPGASSGTAGKANAADAAGDDSSARQHILDSITTIRPPTPPQEIKKFNPYAPAPSRDPPAGVLAEIPQGAENCLAGLTFVFTGTLASLGREEGISLVKQYGGKVTTAPSSKTSFVVLGGDAGPKKLQTIQKFSLKTIDENGLFELIRKLPANGGSGKAGEQFAAKKQAEDAKIKKMAEEIDRAEAEEAAARQQMMADAANPPVRGKPSAVAQAQRAVSRTSSTQSQAPSSGSVTPGLDDRLWTTKYAPTSLNMICGNKAPVERLQTWLRNWRNNAKYNFKKPGKDGSGIYRAVMIHGPPGIGKTTAAHLVAKLEGYDVVESNASDTRSKKLVEEGLRGVLDTKSLGGYFSATGKAVEAAKKNLVLIMDEVDGMSAGDRGGVGALAAVAKKTSIPLIMICNERSLPKMRPFDHVVYEIPFRRPSADQIRARLMTICYREGLKVSPQVLDAFIEGTKSDIRQLVNMLSTAKLDQQALDYEGGKSMSKAWEKHVTLKPWDIVGKILSAQMFAPSNNTSLNEKIELYFNDHEFSYLMLQENYLKTNPTSASRYIGSERKMKLLELFDRAAESISDGDLVDRQIHGSQQQWSLMPTHAAFSFVRPASFVYGNMMERASFTSWLGNNSKQGKMAREIKEIQGHMRLRSSADRHEIRQQYLPTLWTMLVGRLQSEGKECTSEVTKLMDSYYLTREDFDYILELGLGPMDEKGVRIDTQTKSAFTRMYNASSHPVPYMKASAVVAPRAAAKERPDIEEAIDESDEGEAAADDAVEDEDALDLKKDKLVRVPKKRAAPKPRAKKAREAAAADCDDDDDVDPKPKKRARKPSAKKG
ncbi:hypothetical protein KEM52_006207 [Ascosphaera acerosa]|nr:hypothetical protein KEM52_006207 [Ascosphaera acerosa]